MLRAARGFSLVELLFVLVLLAVLSAMGGGLYQDALQRADRAVVASWLQENASMLERYYSEHGSYKLSPTQWPPLPRVFYPDASNPVYTLAFGSLARNTDPDYYVLRATASDASLGYIELLSTGMMRRCVPDGTRWLCSLGS